jgi:hypothetical protein
MINKNDLVIFKSSRMPDGDPTPKPKPRKIIYEEIK